MSKNVRLSELPNVNQIVKGSTSGFSTAVANVDYQVPVILTTTGTSGVSTFNGTTLNIPNYGDSAGTNGTSGTSGTSGINGTSGTSGSSGTSGTRGTSGTTGTSGTSGVNGGNGSSGTSGVNGNNGTSGTSGVNGANGTSGTSGGTGASGTSGTSGVNGANGTSGVSGTSGTSITVSGVPNHYAKFTSTTTIGNSDLYDNASGLLTWYGPSFTIGDGTNNTYLTIPAAYGGGFSSYYGGRFFGNTADGRIYFQYQENSGGWNTLVSYYTNNMVVSGNITATAFYESSDIRFKNILETNPTIDLSGIDVIKFTRTDGDSELIRYGYSAQQIQAILPDLVLGDDKLSVNYADVHTLKIAALEKRISELESRLKSTI